MQRDALISPGYLAQQKAMHARGNYGRTGDKWAEHILDLIRSSGSLTVLDYGCGQGKLGRALAPHGVQVAEYDPAVDGKDELPKPADFVVCTDVLEHIEPERIGAVLAHLRQLTRKTLFAVVSLRPAVKSLPDGRNAHILLKPSAWWYVELVAAGFEQAAVETRKDEVAFVLR